MEAIEVSLVYATPASFVLSVPLLRLEAKGTGEGNQGFGYLASAIAVGSCIERIKVRLERLSEPDEDGATREAIGSLIENIVVTPIPTGGQRMERQLELHGALADVLKHSRGTGTRRRYKETSSNSRSCKA